MFGSIYIGLSGLAAYSKGLQVVSNNISNMNTLGFRSSDVRFSDLAGHGSKGGLDFSNYSGSGHGVTVSDLSLNFNQGEMRQTGRDLDLSIDGNGFFVLLDGADTYYTRTGSFDVGEDGYIVLQGTDYRLATLDEAGRPVALNVDARRTDPPVQTDRITFSDNLSAGSSPKVSVPDLRVVDEGGRAHTWTVELVEQTGGDAWKVSVTDSEGVQFDSQDLKFISGMVDPTTSELVFADAETGLNVTLDFSKVTSYDFGDISSQPKAEAAGHPTGTLEALRVSQDGQIEISYTNGEKKELGAVALADFRDPQSLEQRSKALFAYSGFGQRQYLAATDSQVGSILGGQLEASNVDLGAQFGDLILIQRGFQASSQVISVTNDMIQQLFGIRGQG